MRVVFRADASREMGHGHVMRCLTLADALAARGGRCLFVCRDEVGHLCDEVVARGHELAVIEAHSMLGDARQTAAAMGEPADWLVVDHYALDAQWETALRPACGKLLVVDDLADTEYERHRATDVDGETERGQVH